MKWIAARVLFSAPDPALAADLIADLFDDLGVGGVVIEDPTLVPAEDTDGWEPAPRFRPESHAVTGYLADNAQGHHRLEKLAKGLAILCAREGFDGRIQQQVVDEEDWAEAWKAFFHPVRVGLRVVVKPTWREYRAGEEDIVVEIDPGMAFGTGTHATTAGCIRLLEHFLVPDQRLLDVGCGSGILMAVAARLGGGYMMGVDRDQTAVAVARDNLVQNRISPAGYDLVAMDLISGIRGHFDLVCANILSEVILVLLDSVQAVMRPGGLLICSGIITEREAEVKRKIVRVGMEPVMVLREEGWVAMAVRRP